MEKLRSKTIPAKVIPKHRVYYKMPKDHETHEDCEQYYEATGRDCAQWHYHPRGKGWHGASMRHALAATAGRRKVNNGKKKL